MLFDNAILNNYSMIFAGDVSSNENNGQVAGIHQSNQLGPGIQIASIEELGPG